MGKWYVPKTYNNRRILRVILGIILSVVIAAVVIFLLLFIILENYWIDGQWAFP